MSTSVDIKQDQQLSEIYYEPTTLWKGTRAVKELLAQTDKIPRKKVLQWLSKQTLWQVFLPGPKHIDYPHYEITKPNKMHQADLLYLPHNKVYGSVYKYVLCVIDAASRFKAARPLRTKKAAEVSEMIADIYKIGPLKFPATFQCDNGGEFKADTTKLLEKHDVEIKRATTKYKHTHTAFVERMNRTLAEKLFKIQDAQELQDSEKDSKTWVKHLQNIIEKLNSEVTAMIGMKPKDAVKLEDVPLVKEEEYPKEDILPSDGLYRYLYQPGEEHGDTKKRATDKIWSKNTFRLDRIIEDPNNKVLYYLKDLPKRSYVKEELMLIPEHTEIPPDYVQNW